MCFSTYENGQSFLYLTSPGQNDHFIGYWAEADASRTCPATHQFPNIQTNAWGNVDINFDVSANSWTGFWGYCEDPPNKEFVGARNDQSAANDVDIRTPDWLLGSWLPTEDSGARRNDLYTFNPDNTYVISDGAGMNATGTWIFRNDQLFFDGRPEPVAVTPLGYDLELDGIRHAREGLNGVDYDVVGILGGVDPAGVFLPDWRIEGSAPRVGDYALRYIVLGQADSFRPSATAEAGPAVYVEFWNETEAIKEDEAGNGYRNDTVAIEALRYEVGPNSLTFYGYHPDWGDMYFSAQFDGHRVAAQTSYELGGGPRPANADRPIIVGDLMVKGHIFRDVELYLAFLH
jgi:hypothetical protein